MAISVTEYLFGLQSWRARIGFILCTVLRRVGAGSSGERFRAWMHGPFSSAAGQFEFRPGTMDAWMLHPGHERESHAALNDLLKGRKGIMLDVGGYVGTYGLMHRHSFEKIVYFEPFAENCVALARNVELNGAGDMVVLMQVAVADSEGTRPFYLNNNDTHSLEQIGGAQSIIVDVVTIDGALARAALNPALVRLIKIDNEGAGLAALSGSVETLAAGRPIVLVEANTNMESRALIEFMSAQGYRLKSRPDERNLLFEHPDGTAI